MIGKGGAQQQQGKGNGEEETKAGGIKDTQTERGAADVGEIQTLILPKCIPSHPLSAPPHPDSKLARRTEPMQHSPTVEPTSDAQTASCTFLSSWGGQAGGLACVSVEPNGSRTASGSFCGPSPGLCRQL